MSHNPEAVVFSEHPIPAGYVVASAADLRVKGTPTSQWMSLFEGRWRRCSGPYMRREHWTYLRPLRPGEKDFPPVGQLVVRRNSGSRVAHVATPGPRPDRGVRVRVPSGGNSSRRRR